MRKFVIEKEYKGYTISKYLKEVEDYSSRSIRNLKFLLDNKDVKGSKKLRPLNRLVVIEREKGTNIKPIEMNLNIVYEDQDLLILDKEPFIIVHPTLKKTDKTLANGVVHYFQKVKNLSVVPRFYNRLDMNTSGIIVIAKNSYAQAYLQEKCQVKKWYQAIVKGIVREDEFVVENSIGRVGDNLKREVLEVEAGGQYSKTAFKTLKKFEEEELTLIQCELFTGRTHQIRVHLSTLGYPIIGDELYGGRDERVSRQMLHAYKLKFNNPTSKKSQIIEIELAKDMQKLLGSN